MPSAPLSKFALAALDDLRKNGPKPKRELNPAVTRRLLRAGLVEIIYLPSPYPSRAEPVQHLRLIEKDEKSG